MKLAQENTNLLSNGTVYINANELVIVKVTLLHYHNKLGLLYKLSYSN